MIIEESYPGEFTDLAPEDLRAKLQKALAQFLPRGGEMQVLRDLTELTTDLYRERHAALLSDLASVEVPGGESQG
uniref:Uncharacterized protein n=1 Tax=uncultured Caudovirales phage TaxID=2100421 RepID=A0A6J5L2D0_9CAUD|nr:hypothetical protein UFOVP114_62 [uncultured Caudovirales phage]